MNAVDRTREVLEAYWKEHDTKYVAEDAVFVMMPTGEEIRGREAIGKHVDDGVQARVHRLRSRRRV